MRLQDFLSRYPGTRVASAADNERLLEFFEAAPMRTSGFEVRYQRRPDFFRLLAHQGDRAYVVMGEEPDGSVAGVGTLSLRPGWVEGRATTVGYLGDLRVRPGRRRSHLWRRIFAELLAESARVDEVSDCEHWLTAILDGNREARRALDGRHAEAPQLVPLAAFEMRNLMARLPVPWSRWRAHPRLRVFHASAAEAPSLENFLETVNRTRPFGFREPLARRLERWQGLRLEDFVCAADDQGVVACAAPWSPAPVKQTLVSRVPGWLRGLSALTAILPGHPLRVPGAGEALRAPTLTHVCFAERLGEAERVRVFRALLERILVTLADDDWHCLSLCDFRAWGLGRGLRDFVQQTVPISLYAVVAPGRSTDSARALAASGPPAFEMAMV